VTAVTRASDATDFALPARVTFAEATTLARDMEAALAALPAGADTLRVQAGALAELDTAAIALLLHARRVATARGLRIAVDGASEQLRALAELYGVDALIPGADVASPGPAPSAGDGRPSPSSAT
jgi:phospholipid transport system transporter-binding protein